MTHEEKRPASHNEHAKGATGKENNDNKDNSALTDAKEIGPKEVFDSSKYNAMSDMASGSSLETKNVQTLTNTEQATKDLRSEEIRNESITTPSEERRKTHDISDNPGATDASKITPMTLEERARTIREVNEEKNHQQ